MLNLMKKVKERIAEYGWKYVCHAILYNKIYRHLNNCVTVMAKSILKSAELENKIIIASHNDFDTNGGAFYDFLIRNHYNEKYKIIWLLKNKKPKSLPENVEAYNTFRPSWRKSYHICTAKYFIADDIITNKVKEEQKSYYLTHGSISLKNVTGKICLPDDVDFYLVPSDFWAPVFSKMLGIEYPNNRAVILGYPVHDLFEGERGEEIRKVTQQKYNKVVLWMPTFRMGAEFDRIDSTKEFPLGIPLIQDVKEYEKLNLILQKYNILLLIKIHPMQPLHTIKIADMSNIKILTAETVKSLNVDNYRLMRDSDALISDYSSTSYEYLMLDRPIAYILEDKDEYKLGFCVDDISTMLAGKEIYNLNEMLDFVEDVGEDRDPYSVRRKALREKLYFYHDGKNCERLAKFMGLSVEN